MIEKEVFGNLISKVSQLFHTSHTFSFSFQCKLYIEEVYLCLTKWFLTISFKFINYFKNKIKFKNENIWTYSDWTYYTIKKNSPLMYVVAHTMIHGIVCVSQYVSWHTLTQVKACNVCHDVCHCPWHAPSHNM